MPIRDAAPPRQWVPARAPGGSAGGAWDPLILAEGTGKGVQERVQTVSGHTRLNTEARDAASVLPGQLYLCWGQEGAREARPPTPHVQRAVKVGSVWPSRACPLRVPGTESARGRTSPRSIVAHCPGEKPATCWAWPRPRAARRVHGRPSQRPPTLPGPGPHTLDPRGPPTLQRLLLLAAVKTGRSRNSHFQLPSTGRAPLASPWPPLGPWVCPKAGPAGRWIRKQGAWCHSTLWGSLPGWERLWLPKIIHPVFKY